MFNDQLATLTLGQVEALAGVLALSPEALTASLVNELEGNQ